MKCEQKESSVDIQSIAIDKALVEPQNSHYECHRDEQRSDLSFRDEIPVVGGIQ